MEPGDEYGTTGAHVSALTFVVETLLAQVIALQPTQDAADALVARLRAASRHVPRFVADDDPHPTPVSAYVQEREECVGRIIDQAVRLDVQTVRSPG
jgi:hypothetical protein